MLRNLSSCAVAILACAALAAGCGGNSGLDYRGGEASLRYGAGYDPLAPVQSAPLGMEHIATLPGTALNGRTVIAATASDTADPAVQSAVSLSGTGGTLDIALTSPLSDAALYVRYDATAEHLAGSEIAADGRVSLVQDAAPGLLAVAVSATTPAGLGLGRLARLHFVPGPAPTVRAASIVSHDPLAQVTNLTATDNGDTTVTLQWSERNPGDLDLNGEVNSSDLQRIGKYFKVQYTTATSNYAQLEVCDADGNGEINPADITTIGKNFHARISGYDIYRTPLSTPSEQPDPAATARWTKVENTADPTGPSAPRQYNGQDFRLVYTFVDQSGGGDFGWYVRPTGATPSEEGTISQVTTLTVGTGAPPDAGLSFEIEPPQGNIIGVNDDIYIGVKLTGAQDLFSANVRFEYDGSLLQFVEAVPAYTDGGGSHPNLLAPPLFVGADNVGSATSPYRLLGFNATETLGTAAASGDGVLGYVHFKALATGINNSAVRFPQSSNFIYLWGTQYGVPTNTPALGSPLSISVL